MPVPNLNAEPSLGESQPEVLPRPSTDLGLAPVSIPSDSALSIDIVLLHGLNGTRSTTWTSRQDNFWPLWIGEDIPGARVWVYGYNSSVFYSSSEDHLVLHAAKFLEALVNNYVGLIGLTGKQRLVPVILVGHSLGGILIKQAMIMANEKQEMRYSYLFDSTVAIAFCGTPHRGSIWANRLYALSLSRAPAFVKLLRRRKAYSLSTIADQFNNIWGIKTILTFQEKLGVPVLGRIVMPSDSITNCASEKVYTVDKDHREMVKVEDKRDYFYNCLIDEMKELVKIKLKTKAMPETLPNSGRDYDDISGSRGDPNILVPRVVRKRLWKELCIDPPWENRLYPSGDVEIGSDDHSANVAAENFEGGTFSYQWPPGSTTGVILVADLSTYRFSWTITSPSSSYYPGRHSGIIDLPPIGSSDNYPFKRPLPRWQTPILCPYVNGAGNLSSIYGHWDKIWTPVLKLHTLTTGFAAFLHYGPLYTGISDEEFAQVFRYHPFNPQVDDYLYMTHEPWFRRAANFFCRAYTLEDSADDQEDTATTDEMRLDSIQSIKELLENTKDNPNISVSLDQPLIHNGITIDQSFSVDRIRTRRQWIEEERSWADFLTNIYHVKKTW